MRGFLTSSAVAELLGVSAGTVKRWTETGLLPCARTLGGHRRFDPRDVARLRAGVGAGQGATVTVLLDALLSPADQGVHAILAAERAREGAWWRVAEVLASVLQALGRRWERGEIDVLEEHRASERLARAVARASDALRPRPAAPAVALATAQGEEHTLGLALAELCLREAGWRTVWLGRRTPAGALADAVLARRFDAVVLSASACRRPGPLAREQELLARACRVAGAALVLGGEGPWTEPAPSARVVRAFRGLAAWANDLEGRAPSAGGAGAAAVSAPEP